MAKLVLVVVIGFLRGEEVILSMLMPGAPPTEEWTVRTGLSGGEMVLEIIRPGEPWACLTEVIWTGDASLMWVWL
jgi:hypothetical protein